MWVSFRINGRDLEWRVYDGAPRRLYVRARVGGYLVQATILDDVFARINGRISGSIVGAPLVIGPEFPLGCPASDVPFQLEGGFEIASYGFIHTEFVRSLVGRWAFRRRKRRSHGSPPSASDAYPRAEAGPVRGAFW